MFSLAVEQYRQNPALLISVAIIAFLCGASIGSFLNVVIYRLPLGISVNEPRRSFCPTCKYQIPWYCNLPVFSWILLRGQCANCKSQISPRYILVEVITGMIFLLAVLKFEFPVVIAYWVMLSLFIATVYIDIDHYIIPNEITVGGLCAALVFAAILPQMFLDRQEIIAKGAVMSRVWSVGLSLLGAFAGYALLWVVVHLGKLAFGRSKQVFASPVAFKIHEVQYETGEREPVLFYEAEAGEEAAEKSTPAEQPGSEAPESPETSETSGVTSSGALESQESRETVDLAGNGGAPEWEQQPWSDMFNRPSDRLIMTCEHVKADDREFENVEITLYETRLEARTEGVNEPIIIELEGIEHIAGTCSKVIIPREAMGWGDVKFLAMAGAFMGWGWGVFFTLVAASILGSIFALIMSVLGKRELAARIPFGPYLVFGSALWLFYGRELLDWYLKLTTGES